MASRTLTKVLQYVVTHQEVMTHINVGTPTKRRFKMWCARIESNSHRPFEICGCRRLRCRAKPQCPVSGLDHPFDVYNFPAQALAWSPPRLKRIPTIFIRLKGSANLKMCN
jgi:hypothetical protein